MTIQQIQSSLRFNYAQLDRRPRAPRKDPDPTERARLQGRIGQLRADLHRAQEAAPAPKLKIPTPQPRKTIQHDSTELFPAFAQAQAEAHDHQPAQDAPAAHPWDTGGRGPVGSPKAGQAVLRCPHCKVTFYERPKCPSCGRVSTLAPR